MTASSPWLDIHRGDSVPDDVTDESDSSDATASEDVTGTESEAKTNPWEGVDTARRPSQTDVDLPTPATDSPADD
ncbi:hypothetical protein [Salinibaculum salinum]|uniref:hypothetical protein n=1 Tax=Salinibaculum salinum TaxID=3131996 RepID=UPI0030EBB981